jgi:hypothetical protein
MYLCGRLCEYSGIKIICTKYIYVLWACYNNDFLYHTFEIPSWSPFALSVCEQRWFHIWFKIYSVLFLYFLLVRYGENRITTLRLTNIKFLFQILMCLLMTMYYARFGIKSCFMYGYIITTVSQNVNEINDSKNIIFLRLYKFYYHRIV